MKNIISTFKKVFTFLNVFIYTMLLIVLMAAIWDKSLLQRFNFDWWVSFMVLQIWFNAVIMRKTEVDEYQD